MVHTHTKLCVCACVGVYAALPIIQPAQSLHYSSIFFHVDAYTYIVTLFAIVQCNKAVHVHVHIASFPGSLSLRASV